MTPAAVIFDFDGLVLETEWFIYASIDQVFRRHGTTLDEELWRSFIGTTDHPHWVDILASQIDTPLDREALRAEGLAEDRSVLEALEVNVGVRELMAEAHSAGVPVGVASSSSRDWVEGHLRRLGLWGFVAASATGDEVERTKPDPAVYLLAVDRLGVGPAGVLAIEDSPTGCRAAIAAGLSVLAVPSRMTVGLDFTHATACVDTLGGVDLGALGRLVSGGQAGGPRTSSRESSGTSGSDW